MCAAACVSRKMFALLLFASVERYGVSRMRDFFKICFYLFLVMTHNFNDQLLKQNGLHKLNVFLLVAFSPFICIPIFVWSNMGIQIYLDICLINSQISICKFIQFLDIQIHLDICLNQFHDIHSSKCESATTETVSTVDGTGPVFSLGTGHYIQRSNTYQSGLGY